MFFADPVAAFRNLIRALRPGGRLVMAVWATIDENPHWKIPFEIAVRHLGPPAPQPPHAPGPHAFGDRDYLRGDSRRRPVLPRSRSRRGRFMSASIRPKRRPSTRSRPASCSGCSTKNRPTRRRAQAILRDIEAAFARYATSEGVRLPATFLLVSARRPQ